MPISVEGAYRDPLNLFALFKEYPFWRQEEISSRLLSKMIDDHGMAEVIEPGSKNHMITVEEAVEVLHPEEAIEVIARVPEYSSSDDVLYVLANLMEPEFRDWWDTFKLDELDDARLWSRITGTVLGQRQIAWISAQCARYCFDYCRDSVMNYCEEGIEAAEAWSVRPSSETDRKVRMIEAALNAAAFIDAERVALAAVRNARYGGDGDSMSGIIMATKRAVFDRPASQLALMIRRQITPTLITRPR